MENISVELLFIVFAVAITIIDKIRVKHHPSEENNIPAVLEETFQQDSVPLPKEKKRTPRPSFSIKKARQKKTPITYGIKNNHSSLSQLPPRLTQLQRSILYKEILDLPRSFNPY